MATDINDLKKEVEQLQTELDANTKLVDTAREALVKVTKRYQEDNSKLGVLDRLGKALNVVGTADPIYTFNKTGSTTEAAKKYAANIAEDIASAITAKNMTGAISGQSRKSYKDIIVDQMGMKDNGLAAVLGIVGDISTDPASFGALKPVAKGIANVGKTAVELAKEIPSVESGLDKLGRLFNVFHDVEKAASRFPKGQQVTEDFKKAYADYVKTKDPSVFNQFGKDTDNMSMAEIQRLVDRGYKIASDPRADTKYLFNSRFLSSMDNVMAPGESSTGLLGVYDAITSGIKKIMTVSPSWHLSNAIDSVLKNSMVGVSAKDFWQGLTTKKGSQAWQNFQDAGVVDSFGQAGSEGGFKWINSVANWIETRLARVPAYLKSKRSGASDETAKAFADSIHYNYDKAFFTGFENNIMSRIVPFYSYQKGQSQFWPGAVGQYSDKLSAASYLLRGSEDSRFKNSPQLKPEYMGNTLMMGNFGLGGSSLPGLLQLATGDLKSIVGQLNPIIRMTGEMALDYNSAKGRSISGDTRPGPWKNMPGMGNATSVNPYEKYFVESTAGMIVQPLLKLADPKKAWWEALTPGRLYDTRSESLAYQFQRNEAEAKGTDIGNFKYLADAINRFANWMLGSGGASAATPPTSPSGRSPETIAAYKTWYRSTDRSSGQKYEDVGEQGSVDAYWNEGIPLATDEAGRRSAVRNNLAMLANAMKSAASATTDIAKNAAMVRDLTVEYYNAQKKNNMISDEMYNLNVGLVNSQYGANRPRKVGESSGITWDALTGTQRPAGNTPMEARFARLQELIMNMQNKLGTLKEQGMFNWDPAAIKEQYDHTMRTITAQIQFLGIDMTPKLKGFLEQMAAAALGVYNKKMIEMDMKVRTAAADTTKAWAESLVEGVKRIEGLRDAEEQRFLASEERRVLEAGAGESAVQDRVMAIRAKYARLIQEQQFKESKVTAESVSNTYKDQMTATLAEISRLYSEGKKSVTDMMKEQKAVTLQSYGKSGSSWTTAFLAEMQESAKPGTDLAKSRDELKKMQADLDEAVKKGDLPASIKLLESIYTLMNQIVSGGGAGATEKLQQSIKGFSDQLNPLKKSIEDITKEFSQNMISLQNAITALKQSNIELQLKNMQSPAYGILPGTRKPGGPNIDTLTYQETMKKAESAAAEDVSKTSIALPGGQGLEGGNYAFDSTKQSGRQYLDELEKRIQATRQHYTEMGTLTTEGETKLNEIQARIEKQRIGIVQTGYETIKSITEKRISEGLQMNSMLNQTASLLYDASGKKSREAFYLMKATAFAEASIKGVQSVINAYETGSKINPYVAMAYAAVASAYVGTQLGLIMKQTVNGPEGKAEGGKITKGKGGVDDVNIMAMKDEWVIRASSAKKYGDSFMNALNLGQVDVGSMSFPSLPSYAAKGIAHADGGKVASGQSTTPIKVEIKNYSEPVQATKTEQSFNGTEYVVQVWLDGYNRNVGGLREKIGGR